MAVTRFISCTFVDNETGGDAGGLYVGRAGAIGLGGVAVENCEFRSNIAANAGGMFISAPAVAMITNCTLAQNTATGSAGAILIQLTDQTDSVTINNSIAWGNSGTQIVDASVAGTRFVTLSDIQGGWTGSGFGNINANPLFCNAGLYPLRLQNGSPCIDNGADASVPLDNADLDDDTNVGELLPWDRIKVSRKIDAVLGDQLVDMGAFENPHNQACPFDLNGDNVVGLQELSQLLACFGSPAEEICAWADFNCDGVVDISDLTLLLSVFGEMCPGFGFAGGRGEGNSAAGGEDDLSTFVEWARQASIDELLAWNAEYMATQGR